MNEQIQYKPFNVGLFINLITVALENQKKSVPASEITIDKTIPLNPRHVAECADKGFDLLHRSTNRVYGYFRINACGHEGFYHYGAIRKSKGPLKCSECLLDKLKKEAAEKGLTYIRKVKTDVGEYVVNNCGHTLTLKHSNVRHSQQEREMCSICLQERIKSDAIEQCLELLDLPSTPNKRWYKLPCGHIKAIHTSSVSAGSFRCKECQEHIYKQQAIDVGIEYLPNSPYSHHDYRIYKLKCGCIKEIAIAAVKRKAFECKDHPERKIGSNSSSIAYLIRFDFEEIVFLKVGRAKDLYGPSSRYARYGCTAKPVRPIIEIYFKSGEECHKFERTLHNNFRSNKLNPAHIKDYLGNGFTECYPLSMQETILNEFNSVNNTLLIKKETYTVDNSQGE